MSHEPIEVKVSEFQRGEVVALLDEYAKQRRSPWGLVRGKTLTVWDVDSALAAIKVSRDDLAKRWHGDDKSGPVAAMERLSDKIRASQSEADDEGTEE